MFAVAAPFHSIESVLEQRTLLFLVRYLKEPYFSTKEEDIPIFPLAQLVGQLTVNRVPLKIKILLKTVLKPVRPEKL